MNTENKIKNAKMQSLIERMENKDTYNQAMLNEQKMVDEAIDERETSVEGLGEINSPEKLMQMFSKYEPAKGAFVRFGYFKTDILGKTLPFSDWTENNRWDDRTAAMQGLNDPDINRFMQGDEFKNRQAVSPKTGKPVKSAASPVSDRCLVMFMEFSANYGVTHYEEQQQDKRNAQHDALQKYLDKYEQNVFRMDYAKQISGYAAENPDFDPNNISKDDYETIMNFIPSNDHRGKGWNLEPGMNSVYKHEGTGNLAFRFTIAKNLKQSMKAQYFIASKDGSEVTPITKEQYYNYLNLGKSTPKAKETVSQIKTDILAAVDAVTKHEYNNYTLSSIGYLTFSYADERGEKHRFAYIPSNISMEGITNPEVLVNAIAEKTNAIKLDGDNEAAAYGY